MFTWVENTDTPTRLTVQPTASKTNTPSKKIAGPSQADSTSGKDQTSVSSSNNEMKSHNNTFSKSQHTR